MKNRGLSFGIRKRDHEKCDDFDGFQESCHFVDAGNVASLGELLGYRVRELGQLGQKQRQPKTETACEVNIYLEMPSVRRQALDSLSGENKKYGTFLWFSNGATASLRASEANLLFFSYGRIGIGSISLIYHPFSAAPLGF